MDFSGVVVCEELLIQGAARVLNGTRIDARRINVRPGGLLQVGTPSQPANDVEIYLRHDECTAAAECADGKLLSAGDVRIHGVWKRPWTLLSADAPSGSDSLTVLACEGWASGDAIVVAATGGEATRYSQLVSGSVEDNYWAERRVVTGVAPAPGGDGGGCSVGLDHPLSFRHRGEWLDGIVPTQAEVANLNRSVLVTGPPIHWRDATRPVLGGQGLVTAQVGDSGAMQIEWARVERCGRIGLGQYCLHFHLVGGCAGCAFTGNVVEGGVNKGITIHGTHHASVHENVVFDVRGASIYIEDGNEYNNTLSENVLICPTRSSGGALEGASGLDGEGYRCKLDGVPEHADSDFLEQAAIYTLSASNHFIGNRISGHENALYVNHQGNRIWGIGAAASRTCVVSRPFGVVRGNVFHNCVGFGWYVNRAHPQKILTDADGHVTDFHSCLPFNLSSGIDNGAVTLVEDHVEYYNDFALGFYDFGDLELRGLLSALNNKGLYAKSFRRGAATGPLCTNCTFHKCETVLNGPGGSAAVELHDTTFGDDRVLTFGINHHCGLAPEQTGGLCASHYTIDATVAGGGVLQYIDEAAAGSDAIITELPQAPRALAPPPALFNTSACALDGAWRVCPPSYDVRVLRIYSPDRGQSWPPTTTSCPRLCTASPTAGE